MLSMKAQVCANSRLNYHDCNGLRDCASRLLAHLYGLVAILYIELLDLTGFLRFISFLANWVIVEVQANGSWAGGVCCCGRRGVPEPGEESCSMRSRWGPLRSGRSWACFLAWRPSTWGVGSVSHLGCYSVQSWDFDWNYSISYGRAESHLRRSVIEFSKSKSKPGRIGGH